MRSQAQATSNLLPIPQTNGRFVLAEGIPGVTLFRSAYGSLRDAQTAGAMLPKSICENWEWKVFDQKRGDWVKLGGDGAKLC